MAGKLTLTSRVQASSLLEVIVALVIIVIVFGTAMMIFTNVMRLNLSGQKLKASALLNETMTTVKSDPQPDDKIMALEDIQIIQHVVPVANHSTLVSVEIYALDQNRDTLSSLKQLIIRPHASK